MSAVLQKLKRFKLRALHNQKKFGVAGRNCEEVLRKGCLHLQLPVPGSTLCLYEDGTEVTGDYFWSVPDDSELVLLTAGQTWQGCKWRGPWRSAVLQSLVASLFPLVADVSDISRFLSVFQEPHAELIQAARQLLSDERAPLRQKLLADLLGTVSENIAAETRAEDAPWFEGLESRFRNKSGYLRYSCESRIRSYLREVTSGASLVVTEAREEYLRVVGAMCQKLQAARYNSSYFDRGAKAGRRLCTPEGWFSCQGPFDVDDCASRHSINPYSNRESRVLFSTWNLDHVIEKKRTVVPTLAAAIHDAEGREVDWKYFYRLLFTSENLKLVHIACHKKTTHKLLCDPSRIYRAPAVPRRKRRARQRP
ncbi:DNA fragmentation factor subunit beta isoform X7 [Sagmatias obliquidens]|uniref:DNA fragmentation factor subunit beta n=1 Tax=Tursiops truncatus TaxID=9739 RepID=A0A2U4B017_TURTR|nr:DNA fragmentation factor subunit beta isoform X7 [Tursiops truncatus]XP_026966217.1 DNA fragmentation factor subunit beta isoform X7 [Lagenorhynchus obliquidens]XP_030736504.1 DNA fragmentation factor subunit beta isoform X7 [Globicephala melas]